MRNIIARVGVAIAALLASPALAQSGSTAPRHAIGADISFSTDADQTDVLRLGANFDWRYRGADDYLGFRLERVAYRPSGQQRTIDERVYLRAASALGDWTYHAAVGSDGKTVLGSLSLNDSAPLRKDIFVERDKVETPIGVRLPIYATFLGGTLDIPLSRKSQLTLLAGAQAFTGKNVRTHARVNFIQSIKEDLGLSAQLRSRYFRNSVPSEYDYFSPRWYVEVVPVIQLRRFSGGWQYVAAGGWGAQRDSRSDWRQSRYANLRVQSPASRRGWIVGGEATYSNTPITQSDTYDYLRAGLSLTRAF